MTTQTIGTLRQRWITFLLGSGWRLYSGRSQAASAIVEPVTFRLVRNQLLRLQKSSGLRVLHVRQGIIWLTGTPARGDVILYPGDRFDCGGQWPFVLQALEDAEIELFP